MKRLVAGTVCLVAACAALAVWWTAADRLRTTGDEPHYLIIAASVLRDGDLDVTNNYEEDARTAEIYGWAIVFEIAEALRDVEFRVIAYPGVDLLADYVDLRPVLPRPERPQPAVIVELPA